jgi:quinol monooxygenase YgiN
MIADVHGLAGRAPELQRLLGELAAGAREEDGCETYRVLAADEPGDFLVLAGWRDDTALRAHYTSDHFQRYRASIGMLLARPSDVSIHTIASTVHATDPDPPDPGHLG